jgi:multiple sugar transport system substrate-binding protein
MAMLKRKLNRRDFMRLSTALAAGSIAAACAPATPVIIEREVIKEVPVEKAVIIEKEVPKEVIKEVSVEKVVKETVVVEKEVEKIVEKVVEKVVAQKAVIRYEDWGSDTYMRAWEWTKDQFLEEHPGIDVIRETGSSGDETMQKVIAQSVAGTAPDIFNLCCHRMVRLDQEGFLFNMRPLIEADMPQEDIDDFLLAQLQFFRSRPDEARWFALPQFLGTLGIFWNQDMFDEMGVDHPPRKWQETWDHDEYRETMLQLVQRDDSGKPKVWGGQGAFWWDRVQMHVNAFGGHWVDPDDWSKCAMSWPETKEALEWLRAAFWDDNTMPQPVQTENLNPRDLFPPQRVASMEEGAWALIDIVRNEYPFQTRIAPFPKGPAETVTLATSDGFGIAIGSRHPYEAWELVQFLSSPVYERAIAKAHMLQPSRKSVLAYWYEIVRETYPVMEGVDMEVFGEGVELDLGITSEIFKDTALAYEMLQPAIDQLLKLGKIGVEGLDGPCADVTETLQGM